MVGGIVVVVLDDDAAVVVGAVGVDFSVVVGVVIDVNVVDLSVIVGINLVVDVVVCLVVGITFVVVGDDVSVVFVGIAVGGPVVISICLPEQFFPV